MTNAPLSVIIAKSSRHGSVPERPKGADCKSVVTDFGGPNPPAPTKNRPMPLGVGLFFMSAMAEVTL